MTRDHATLNEKSSCKVCWNQGQGRCLPLSSPHTTYYSYIIRESLQCRSRDLARDYYGILRDVIPICTGVSPLPILLREETSRRYQY